MEAIGGNDDTGEADGLYDDNSAEEEEEASEQEEEEVEQIPAKKRRISHSNNSKSKPTFKSKEFISDSDDSSNETAPQIASTSKSTSTSMSANAQAVPKKRKSTVVSESEDSDEVGGKVMAKGKGKGKEKKSKEVKEKKPRKAPAAKPGDAAKGSDLEENRIKKLKVSTFYLPHSSFPYPVTNTDPLLTTSLPQTLLAAAGLTRPFTPSTGAERTLSPSARLALLAGLLNELGLKTSASTLPSLAMCKEVGERKALEREMKVCLFFSCVCSGVG